MPVGASPFSPSSNGSNRLRARARLAAVSTLVLAVTAAFIGTGTASASSVSATSVNNAARSLTPRPANAAPAVIPGALTYHGGLVQNAPRVYVDYWGWSSDPKGEQAYLNRFLSSVGGTSWLTTVNQYGGGALSGLLAGTWSDPVAVPAAPSDAQIQAEAASAANHFGTGTSVNVEIVVATPTGHSTPGFGSQWCAYHGKVAAKPLVTYTDLPYIPDAGTTCGQGSVNGGAGTLDGVSIVEGHELAESITDPLLNAWLDSGGNEIGDKCAWSGLGNVNLNGNVFPMQPLWSNAANGCVLSSPPTVGVDSPGSQSDFQFDPVNVQMIAVGGTPPYTWSATGLPVGVTINSSSGQISGEILSKTNTTVTVTARDTAGRTGSVSFFWMIECC